MSIEGQGHFFTIYVPGFVCFVLYLAKISGERLQDHWSSGFYLMDDMLYAELDGMLYACYVLKLINQPLGFLFSKLPHPLNLKPFLRSTHQPCSIR